MLQLRFRALAAFLALAAGLYAPPAVWAASTLVTYELQGVNSPVTSVPPTTMAPGVTGDSILRNGTLTDVSGTLNGFNSQGWDVAGNFVSLGFNVTGAPVTFNDFDFGSRSSATGPGSMNVYFSVNGGPLRLEDTVVLPTTSNVYTDLRLASPITVSSSLLVEFAVTPGTLAVNGGPIGSSGTWRLIDYSPDNGTTHLPIAIGTVPEPSSIVLAGIAIAGSAVGALVRRKRFA